MPTVRAFDEADIGQVADLHRRVFSISPDIPDLDLTHRRYFAEVFLGDATSDPVRSLVWDDGDGTIAGFLGVVPRRMSLAGRPLLAAVSSQFVVDPASRSRLVGVAMLRAFMTGPQDLSIADEANALTAGLWEALGGVTAPLYSTHWIRPLAPFRMALSAIERRRKWARFPRLTAPVARNLDALVPRVFPKALPRASANLFGESTTPETLLEHARTLAERRLRPEKDDRTLSALSRLRGPPSRVRLESVVVRDARRRLVGTYAYRAAPSGVGEVVQLAAAPDATRPLIEHLLSHALERGASALKGRLDPPFMQALSDAYAVFHRQGSRMLVYAKKPELVAAFQRGDAAFSRLDGEYCLRFVHA